MNMQQATHNVREKIINVICSAFFNEKKTTQFNEIITVNIQPSGVIGHSGDVCGCANIEATMLRSHGTYGQNISIVAEHGSAQFDRRKGLLLAAKMPADFQRLIAFRHVA